MVPKSNGLCTTFRPKYSYLRSSAIPTSHLLPFWGWGGLLYLCRGRGGHGGSSALPLHRWHDYEAKLQLETARGWGKNWRPQGPQRPPRPAVSSSFQQYPAVAKVGLFGLLALGQLHGCKMATLATLASRCRYQSLPHVDPRFVHWADGIRLVWRLVTMDKQDDTGHWYL